MRSKFCALFSAFSMPLSISVLGSEEALRTDDWNAEFHGDEWDAVGDKTEATLLYSDAVEDFHGTLKAKLHSNSFLRAKTPGPSIEDKRVQFAGDDIIPEGLNVADIESTFPEREDDSIKGRRSHRELAGSTAIKIKNNCDESAAVLLVARNSNGGYSGKWSQVAPNSETQSSVITTYDEQFFLYADSENHEWAGESQWCFSGGKPCLKTVPLNGNPTRFTYTIGCGSAGNQGGDVVSGGGGNNGGSNGGEGQGDMTDQDKKWLQGHNDRRKKYHGDDYVPLKWNKKVKDSAQSYANKLIARDGCKISHGWKDDTYGGENLGANWGGGPPRPPSRVLEAWVEREVDLPFGRNLHFTQVIWKASLYVGCAEASKAYNGGMCHIQVCRYIRPGNCNVNAQNFWTKMLERETPCTPYDP